MDFMEPGICPNFTNHVLGPAYSGRVHRTSLPNWTQALDLAFVVLNSPLPTEGSPLTERTDGISDRDSAEKTFRDSMPSGKPTPFKKSSNGYCVIVHPLPSLNRLKSEIHASTPRWRGCNGAESVVSATVGRHREHLFSESRKAQ